MNEAETCRKLVRPKLEAAGRDNDPHSINQQVSFADGRIVVAGSKTVRGEQKRADFHSSAPSGSSTPFRGRKSCGHATGPAAA